MTRALTKRQREVIEAASRGLTAAQIADELGIAPDTARTHEFNVIRRMHAKNMTEAVARYVLERAEIEAREELLAAIERDLAAHPFVAPVSANSATPRLLERTDA